MSLFQHTVLKKQIASRIEKIQEAYKLYAAYFLNPDIQGNIRNSKEEQFQEGFLRELFVKILGYTLNPEPNYNLITEKKNETNSKKADGAILINGEVKAVIELKDHKTTDLKQVETQAFGYKNNNRKTSYVIISNFEKLRFYIDNTIDFVEFNLFNLTFDAKSGASPAPTDDFAVLWICLAYENIFNDLPKQLRNESVNNEDRITKQLYKDYSAFKQELYADIVANQQQGDSSPCYYDRLTLFKKTQKLLDRMLFIFFAEDGGLLPPNSMSEIIVQWEKLNELDEYRPLYERIKKYFSYMNTGFKGKKYDVFAYNGGLFKPDEVLDNVVISDEVLRKHALKLSQYDFASEVDVNILGHIFENSLTEIETVGATLAVAQNTVAQNAAESTLAPTSKRKKDGVFYTPRYITTYIVENTLGKLCADKKSELEIDESEYYADKKRQKATTKKLADKLDAYRNWLLSLTICDPACGSGAFLNAALDFLMNEHRLIDEMTAKIFGGGIVFPNIENAILENNLYGVDINEESVEIARLALWLRTAKPQRKLNSLNNNIKCGNSLISPTTTNNGACPIAAGNSIAGNNGASPIVGSAIGIEKAFDWHTEFPQVFKEKDKQAFHVTWVTYNSRLSQRVIDYKVEANTESVYLSEKEELIVTQAISEIINEDNLNCIAYNICGDHVHILLVCEEEELPGIVRKLKSVSARKCNIAMERTIPHGDDEQTLPEHGETQYQLWAQKFDKRHINNNEQLVHTITYIKNNKLKHELSTNNGACPIASEMDDSTNNEACLASETDDSTNAMGQAPLLVGAIESMTCSIDHAFRPEYKGGFDVVIGNPPYVFAREKVSSAEKDFYSKNYLSAKYQVNTYILFMEQSFNLLKQKGLCGLIIPNSWLMVYSGEYLRKFMMKNCSINQIVSLLGKSFEDANVETVIMIAQNKPIELNHKIEILKNEEISNSFLLCHTKKQADFYENKGMEFNIFSDDKSSLLIEKLKNGSKNLDEVCSVKAGLQAYEKGKGIPQQSEQDVKNRPYDFKYPYNSETYKYLEGADVLRYNISWSGTWLWYGAHLAAPRTFDLFSGEKIIVREITGKYPQCIIATYSNETYLYNRSNIAIIKREGQEISLKYITTILNSSLMSYYFVKNTAKAERKLFPKIILNDLRLFPIKELSPEQQQPFITLADQMLSLNTDLQTKRQRFLKRLSDNFNVTTNKGLQPLVITNALEHFDTLEFKQFLAELKKQKITLSLKQQDEWEEYFSDYKSECTTFVQQIEATDKEIDRMVYALYGLMEDEVEIIENK